MSDPTDDTTQAAAPDEKPGNTHDAASGDATNEPARPPHSAYLKKAAHAAPLLIGLSWFIPALILMIVALSAPLTAPVTVISLVGVLFGSYKLISGALRVGRPVPFKNVQLELITLFIILTALFVNGIAANRRTQWDMTETKRFTISDDTLALFRAIDTPIYMTWYLSSPDKLPPKFVTLRRNTLDRLDSLVKASGGKFHYTVIDPSDNNELRSVLKRKGIVQTPYAEQSLEGTETRNIWSTMVLRAGNQPEQYIPSYDDLDALEFMLANRVMRLSRPVKPRVAVALPPAIKAPGVSGLYRSQDYYSGVIERYLGYYFDLFGINLDSTSGLPRKLDRTVDAIRRDLKKAGVTVAPPMVNGLPLTTERGAGDFDMDVLILIKPSKLEPRWEYEIERFLASGGSVILFQSGVKLNFNEKSRNGPSISHETIGFKNLFDTLGVTIGDKLLFGDQPLIMMTPQGYQLNLTCINLIKQKHMNESNAATYRIAFLITPFATPIYLDESKLKANPAIHMDVLFTSDPKSATRDYDAPKDPSRQYGPRVASTTITKSYYDFYAKPVTRNENPGKKILAVDFSGKMPWRWAGKKLPGWEQEPAKNRTVPPLTVTPTERRSGNLIIVSSSEFLNDPVFLAPYRVMDQLQMQFMIQLLGKLTASDMLGNVQRKTMDRRPLKELTPEKFQDFSLTAFNPETKKEETVFTDRLRSGGGGKGLVILCGAPDHDALFSFYEKIGGGDTRRMLQVGDKAWHDNVLTKENLEKAGGALKPGQRELYQKLKDITPPEWPLCGDEQISSILMDKYFISEDISEPFYVYIDEEGAIALKGELKDTDPAALDKLADAINAHKPVRSDTGMKPVLKMQLWMVLPVPIFIAILWGAWYVFRTIRRVRFNRRYGL